MSRQLSEDAVKHILDMDYLYNDEIRYSAEFSRIYTHHLCVGSRDNELEEYFKDDFIFEDEDYLHTTIIVVDKTTTEQILSFYGNITIGTRVAALNFANFLNPGGGYLYGDHAQEETICADSFLYNVLNKRRDFYEDNIELINNDLYSNRAIYSPFVRFFGEDGKDFYVDILTCAAPDLRFTKHDKDDVYKALVSRIEFIKFVLESEHVDIAILGAFGCGAFKNDPVEVASIFRSVFLETKIPNIIFAIPTFNGKDTTNYDIFKEVLNYGND